MTKTLTEQWRNDTIDRSHHYYVRIKGKKEIGCGGIDFIDIIRPPLFIDQYDKIMKYNDPEVLAPVPSYTELTLMAGNYRLVKKALRDCYNEMKYLATMNHRCSKIFNHIKAALVEIKEVK